MRMNREAWKLLQALVDNLSGKRRALSVPQLLKLTGMEPEELARAWVMLQRNRYVEVHPRGGLRVTYKG